MTFHSWIINSSHLLNSAQGAHCVRLPIAALQNDGTLTGVAPRRLSYVTRLRIMVGWIGRKELKEDG
jgi:hypothetical protein